ncbi:MAG TPA: hypothetical protein G4O14_03255 [Anaerolineae bacterium]|nr:hypothetical protein [Anaerolineae bacterium]
MNHLVFLEPRAMELEKILSGVKTMIAKEFDPARSNGHSVRPGDRLYFLRNKDECDLRVKATVVRVVPLINCLNEDLSQTLKEMQPKLQLTEEQFDFWSTTKQVLLVEFVSAQKITPIHVASNKITDRSDWIAFEDFSLITE